MICPCPEPAPLLCSPDATFCATCGGEVPVGPARIILPHDSTHAAREDRQARDAGRVRFVRIEPDIEPAAMPVNPWRAR